MKQPGAGGHLLAAAELMLQLADPLHHIGLDPAVLQGPGETAHQLRGGLARALLAERPGDALDVAGQTDVAEGLGRGVQVPVRRSARCRPARCRRS